MKTNLLKTGIAIIIAFACSYAAFCNANALQNPSSINSPSQVQLGKEIISKDKSSDDFQSSDDYQAAKVTTDSGWVQKDGYLENALQVGSISYFRYSNDGQYLFTFGSDYTFRKWDVKTGKVVKEKKFEGIQAFDLQSDDETIAIIRAKPDQDNFFIFKNDSIISKTDIYKYFDYTGYSTPGNVSLCFRKNFNQVHINMVISSYLYGTYSTSGENYCWNYDSSKMEYSYFLDCEQSMLSSTNGMYLLVSSSYYSSDSYKQEAIYEEYLNLVNLEEKKIEKIEENKGSYLYTNLAFSNDSRFLAVSRNNTNTFVWDIENWKNKFTINIPNLNNNKFSADDRFLITTLEKPDTSIIKFFLAESGVEADSIAYQGNIGNIAVSPDSVTVAVGGLDGYIRIFQPKIFNKQFFASFTSDTLIKQLGEPIYFKDNSFNNPTSWHWDFGDGTTSTEQNPVHYYKTKALFSVRLIASNGTQIDTLTRKDFIKILIPVVANFDSYITQDTVPLNVQFFNQSQGDIKNYSWNFGNNKTSNEENPSILFDKWGEFDVSLIVTDGYFSDSILISKKIKVIPPAIPFFTNKLEKRFVQNNQSYYGIDGIQTYDGNFVFIANVYDVETYYYYDEFHYKEIYRNKMFIKMDSLGNVIWEKNLTKGKKLAQLLDSCLIIVDDSVTSRNEIYVAKYNQKGEFLWERFHRTQTLNSDSPTNIKATRDSGYVIAAESYYQGDYRASCFKVDKEGNQTMYKATYNGRNSDIFETTDSCYYLITNITNNKNIMLIKINSIGKLLWQKNCNDKLGVFSSKSLMLSNGDLVIAGRIEKEDKKSYIYVIKVDSLGNKIWDLIGTTANSQYYSISSISDTLFAATGNFNNQIGIDIINNQGELVNSVRFPERNGAINSIVTTKDNDLFLTGSITPPFKLSQLYTLLLKHPYIITSVEDEQTENIANPEQPFSIFPNPTNTTATLQYKIETSTHLKIELINFIGMKVSEIENAYKEEGEYNSLINFESLRIAKGIYFVRFIANGNVFVSKVIFY